MAYILILLLIIPVMFLVYSIPDGMNETKKAAEKHPQGFFALAFIMVFAVLALILFLAES